jgi:hypothetical protein
MSKKERKQCCVADAGCHDSDEATANQRMPSCFACGLDVCTNCSNKRKYLHYGIKRICHSCSEHIDGNDDLRTFRAYLAAGYKVTKAWVKAMRIYQPINEMYPYTERESLRAQIARWKREFEAREKARAELIETRLAEAEKRYGKNSAMYRKLSS